MQLHSHNFQMPEGEGGGAVVGACTLPQHLRAGGHSQAMLMAAGGVGALLVRGVWVGVAAPTDWSTWSS